MCNVLVRGLRRRKMLNTNRDRSSNRTDGLFLFRILTLHRTLCIKLLKQSLLLSTALTDEDCEEHFPIDP